MSRTVLLQDWITVRSSLSSVAQSDEGWLDLPGFGDAAFWVDVSEVTPPGGTSTNGLQLYFETSPSPDESLFLTTAGPLLLGSAAPFQSASPTPLVATSVASVSTISLARYVRWRLAPIGSGTWSVTFRVRVAATRQRMFSPRSIADCALWLRSDLGITLDTSASNNVKAWADQSGNGRDAAQTTATAEPPYVQSAVNGLPAIQGDGSSKYMKTPSFASPSSATFFAAVQPSVTTQAATARICEQDNRTSYFFGADLSGTGYKLVVANNTYPFGSANTGTVALAPSIVSATYDSGSGTGTIYYDGGSAASSSFPSPSGTLPLYILSSYFGSSFWQGYLAELIVYSRALSQSERLRVHRYLGGRYGVAIT